ncbi:MAG: photosystem II reaction center PsbP family protein, partial [Chloroflexota bacterium]|nr:photosystem II reaction center PsbP family protein [Chloroflexota bacterium]
AQAPPTPTQTPTPAPTPSPSPTRTPPPAPTPSPTRGAAPVPGAWGPTLAPLNGGRRYADPQGRFSFSVPQGWNQSNTANAEVAFNAPGNAASMTVTLQEVPASATIDSYNQALEGQLPQQFPGYTHVSLDRVLVGNNQAYKRLSQATISGQVFQIEQVYFVANGAAHMLTFGSPPASFAAQEPTFDGIAGSYRAGR